MFMQTPPPPPPKPTPITIFVHGTQMHALFKDVDLSSWFPPTTQAPAGLHATKTLDEGHQTRECLEALAKANPAQFCLESSYVFGWSGSIELEVRKQAGKDLFDLLKSLALSYEQIHNKKPEITVITHSHGGNILMHMAEQCTEGPLPFMISRLIFMAIPVQDITLSHIHHPLFNTVYSLHSHDDHVQVMDPEWAQIIRSAYNDHPDIKGIQAFGQHIASQIKAAQINKLGSGRHFGSQTNMIQSAVTWNVPPTHKENIDKGFFFELALYHIQHWFSGSRGVLHTEFTTPVFFEKIPYIIHHLDEERASQGPLSHCLSLHIDGS